MPDHLHLFVCFDSNSITLSDWVKSLKNTLSRHWREHGVPAPHWQKGFFDHVMRSAESYDEKWAYVAQNPARAGLVSSGDKWPFEGTVHELSL